MKTEGIFGYGGLALILVIGIAILFTACDSDRVVTRGDLKNRVVTLPDSTEAKQAAAEAKASAQQASDTLKKIEEAQKTTQPPIVYTPDGTPQEQTRVGRVTDVTEVFEVSTSSSMYGEAYEAMSFVDETGFQKRFYPVCSDQTIQTGKPEIIMYHWKPNLNHFVHNQKGCYAIDGYLYQKVQ